MSVAFMAAVVLDTSSKIEKYSLCCPVLALLPLSSSTRGSNTAFEYVHYLGINTDGSGQGASCTHMQSSNHDRLHQIIFFCCEHAVRVLALPVPHPHHYPIRPLGPREQGVRTFAIRRLHCCLAQELQRHDLAQQRNERLQPRQVQPCLVPRAKLDGARPLKAEPHSLLLAQVRE